MSALLMAFFQALGVASILPFMNLIMQPDIVQDNQWVFWFYNSFGFESIDSFIFFLGFVMLGVIIISNLVSVLATWLKLRFAWKKNHNLSTSLLRKYLALPYVYFLDQHSADLSKNVLNEVLELTKSFMIPMLQIITKTIVALFILGMLFIAKPVVSLVALVVIGGSYAVIYSRFRKKLRTGGNQRLEANRGRFKITNEALGGIKDIKIMGREPFFIERFITFSKRYSDLRSWNEVVGQVPRYILEVIAFGGVITLILFLLSVEGNAAQVIPLVSFFAFAGYRLMPAMQDVFQALTKVQFNRAVLDKIFADLHEGETQHVKTSSKQLPEPLVFQNSIKFDHISFWYPNTNEPVLKDINLEIQRHESVAIIGPTGSGKTTLADIFLGLLTPQQGELIVDDTEITHNNLKMWQRNLGYVPQQIYLSDDTIARNIAFGLPDDEIDPAALDKATKIANLHDFILQELPKGYDTVVGERGIRLSGGQRQRVGIARALYHDPEILVLDEATSSLDGITEDAVLQAMENAAKSKTLIVIAHRLTTIMNSDVIYLMDRGEIAASGNYLELLNSNKQFRAMAKAVQ